MQRHFTTLVRTLLKEQSMSGNQLAEKINYDRGAMARILTGQRPCSQQVAELIDNVLNAQGQVIAAAGIAAAPHSADRACRTLNAALRRQDEPAREVTDWAQAMADFGQRGRCDPPPLLLGPLTSTLRPLSASIAGCRSALARRDLTRIAALLAGLVCRTFIITGDQPRWTQWARTARLAATAAADSATLGWIISQEAVGHYYAGDVLQAAVAADTAVSCHAGAGAARAFALQMRIHATAGDAAAALAAARSAERLLSRRSPSPSAWDYDDGQFAFHRAEALFFLGDPAARRDLSDASGQAVSRDDYLYWTATRFIAAASMIRDGDAAGALAHVGNTVTDLRPEERLGLITCQCRDIIALLPRSARESDAGHALRSLLLSQAVDCETGPPPWSAAGPKWAAPDGSLSG